MSRQSDIMDTARKNWNTRQKELRTLLSKPASFISAIEVFLRQHAEVHTKVMSSHGNVSFEDEVLRYLSDAQIREVPDREEHSIAWILWHLARVEDVTMNMLVAGEPQLFDSHGWKSKLGTPILHTGNAMSRKEILALSKAINVDELRNYRLSVGRKTDEVVSRLKPGDVTHLVSPTRLEQVMEEGAVVKEALVVIDYWSKRTIAGLLLMPPTRHCFIHLNEAGRLKKKLS